MNKELALCFRLTATLFVLCLFLKGFFPLKKKWASQPSKGHQSNESNLNLDLNVDKFETNYQDENKQNTDLKYKFMNFQNVSQSFHDYQRNLKPTKFRSNPRVILMVIDAFREDFAYGPMRFMPFMHKILSHGHGLKYTAETMPPTVTLPRIKAMVTGSTSSFADVILNFGSSALEEDNIISQLKAHGQSIVFHGDDTWLKLFPNHFDRSSGTTSFFVSDYTEVDNNVTQHLQYELDNAMWDLMILHYLGLDHIGHFAGPRSPLIAPKLAEMDDIISQIYQAMESWEEPSLLIVCGDHGMSDQGGHGGATPSEISVPLIFLSPQITNADPKHGGLVSQTDLCPTLAVILGVPIPSGNIGQVITEALTGYTLPQKVAILYHNAVQSMQVLGDCVSDLHKESAYLIFREAKLKLRKWLVAKNDSLSQRLWESQGEGLLTSFSESLRLISEQVSKLSTQYDVYAMAVSIVLMWMILVSLLLSSMPSYETAGTGPGPFKQYLYTIFPIVGSAVLSHIIMCTGSVPSNLMCSATGSSVAIQTTLAVMFVCLALHIVNSWPPSETLLQQFKALQSSYSCYSLVEILLLLGTVVHTFSLLSSSFVEEEHQTFYCLGTTVHLLILAQLVIKFAKGFRKTSSGQTVKTAAFGLDQEKDERFDDVSVMDMDKESDLYEDHNVNYCNDEGLQIALNTSANSSHSSSSQNETLGDEMAGSMIFRSDTLSHQQADMADGSCTNHEKGSVSEMSDVQADPQSGMSNMSFLHWAFSVLVVLLVLRVSRRLNHTGNKWLDIPDFGDWLVKPENKGYLSMLTVFSFMIIAASRGSRLKRVQSMCVNLALSCAYLSRAAQGTLLFPFKKILSSSGIMEAKASYLFITVTCLVSLVPKNFLKLETDVHRPAPPHPSHQPAIRHSNRQSQQCSSIDASTSKPKSSVKSKEAKSRASDAYDGRDEGVKSSVDSDNEDDFSIDKRLRGFMSAVVCFAFLVKQPHNAPVVAVMSLTEQMMTPVLLQINLKPVCAMLYCVWMAHVFFFLQGNSNSLSTVDIAAAYVGLDSYWPEVNGMLMFAATYVSNIFWAVALLNILWITRKHLSSSLGSDIHAVCTGLLLTRALPLSVYMALVAAQRYHLFVWSVFSPKLLYEAANTVAVALQLLLFVIFRLLTV